MLKKLTLKIRLLLVVILSGAFFITLGLVYIAQVRTSLTQEVVVERGAVLQSVLEERLKAKEEFGIGFAVMLSERAEVIWSLKSGRRDTLTEPLERILTRFRETTNYRGLRVQVHTDEGVSWLRSWNHEHHGDDVRFRPSIQRMLSEKAPFASSDEMGRAGFAIRALAPIYDRNQYIGSLEVLQGVGSISRDFEAEGRFYLLLLNQNMVDISPPLASNTAIGGYVVANNNWFNDRTINIVREMDLTELSETGYYYAAGTRYFATATPLIGDDGQVLGMHIVGEPIELLNANIQQATSTAWAFMGLLVLLVIGMGLTITWVIQSSVVRPIAKSVSFLAKKQNDLTARLKVGGQDELGSLFNAFNQHTETLAKVLGEVSQTADHLGESADQLLGASDHSSHLALDQQKETDQVASASAQMAVSSTEMADHAAATLSAAEEAQQQTDQGSAIVTTTITAIESLADRMKQMIPVIERLNQGSQDIGQVIDTISEVAAQTNLLALNAAIEAARAGEHGRGFAVVADEVRMLASRTQDATGEIHRIIQEVRSASKDVSNAIEVGTKDAFECAQQAQKAGSALELIKEAVSMVNERGEQISNAASEQSQVANEVSESMVRIHELAEQNTKAAEETRRVNQELAGRSNKLKALVDKFKI